MIPLSAGTLRKADCMKTMIQSPEKAVLPGVTVDNVDRAGALRFTFSRRKAGKQTLVVTPNAEIAYRASRDTAFSALLSAADLVLPDGQGVVLASRLLGTPLKAKVAGIDYGESLLHLCALHGLSVFLYGGKPGVAEAAAENMSKRFPGLKVAGTADGYHPLSVTPDADVLFVCLGSPKQEEWAAENRASLPCSVIACLGGSVDVWAGKADRAPLIMRKAGLEWLFRLIKEPSRLPRMLSIPGYLLCTMKTRTERNRADLRRSGKNEPNRYKNG